MNFDEFCARKDRFLIYLQREKNLSQHTIRAYTGDLNQLIAVWQRTQEREKQLIPLQTIVERYVASLQSQKINRASIARKISCLHSYEKYIEQHEGDKLHLQLIRPRVEQKVPEYLSIDEICFLLDGLPAERMPTPFPARDKAILELLYATGMLCSELVAIRIKDLNFNKKTILIQHPHKAERLVIFGSACEKKLLEYLSTERTAIKHPAEFLFLNYRNEPLTTRSVQRICGMFSAFLGSQRSVTPHILRHSFAAHLVNQGTDVQTLQTLLGYKTITSTEKYTSL